MVLSLIHISGGGEQQGLFLCQTGISSMLQQEVDHGHIIPKKRDLQWHQLDVFACLLYTSGKMRLSGKRPRPERLDRQPGRSCACLLYTSIFACDPLVELEDTPPFIQTIPAGTYPVKICVVPSEKYGDRYACVKVEVSREKPVRYELGMTGKEDLDGEVGEDEYFGFGVDAGMEMCIRDRWWRTSTTRMWCFCASALKRNC